MLTRTIRAPDGTLETAITDEDVARSSESQTVENTGNPAYSAAFMRRFRRVKRVTKEQDAISRKVVAEMQDKLGDAKAEMPVTKPAEQRTFADFTG